MRLLPAEVSRIMCFMLLAICKKAMGESETVIQRRQLQDFMRMSGAATPWKKIIARKRARM